MLYDKEPTGSVMLPLFLLTITFVGFLGMQTWLLVADHTVLGEAKVKQATLLAQVEKAKVQIGNLVKGVSNLAKQDNRVAQDILENLKKAGMNFQDAPKGAAPAAAAPVPEADPGVPAAAPAVKGKGK
ncbi:MAG: hypothetical protein PHE27_09215 [Alphaproteobacteria bacterium]|nr:hypothetical protein [Alphaproteobacteria bacterium]